MRSHTKIVMLWQVVALLWVYNSDVWAQTHAMGGRVITQDQQAEFLVERTLVSARGHDSGRVGESPDTELTITLQARGQQAEPLVSAARGHDSGRVRESPAGRTETGIQVIDGDTIRLSNGEFVRLLAIQAPEMGIKKGRKEPLAEEATQYLKELIGEGAVMMQFDSRKKDRFGRWLAHLYLPDGRWLQEEMLRAGMAFTYSFADNRAHLRALLKVEAQARKMGKGLWSHEYYAVIEQAQAGQFVGRYKLVEGRVFDHAFVKGKHYINFSEDWRSDFTGVVSKKHAKAFKGYKWPEAGDCVRLRGWLRAKNGPAIYVTHPEQVERLSDDAC